MPSLVHQIQTERETAYPKTTIPQPNQRCCLEDEGHGALTNRSRRNNDGRNSTTKLKLILGFNQLYRSFDKGKTYSIVQEDR